MNRWVLLFSVGGFLILFILSFWLTPISKADRKEYAQLTNPLLESGEELTKYPSKQHREHVQKDLFLADKGERLHSRIVCQSSDIVVLKNGESHSLAEKMQAIICEMQAEIRSDPLSQVIRYFTADKGTYYYAINRFIANHVDLYRYHIPGEQLVDNLNAFDPTMKGVAQSVIMNFGKEIDFKANKLKVTLYTNENPL